MSVMQYLKRSSMLAGLTAGIVALAPGKASAGGPSARPEARHVSEQLIITQGVGRVSIRPDSLRVEVGVEAQADTVEKAQNEVNTRMERVIQAIQRLQIAGLVLQTETLQISPVYSEPQGNQPPRIVGYRASNSVSATVRGPAYENLGAQGSRIVDAAVRAGANRLLGISFFASDLRDAQARSLKAAVEDAERNARTMADAARVSLDGLVSLEGGPESGPRPLAFERVAAAAPTPVEVGEIVVTSQVTAKFMFQRR